MTRSPPAPRSTQLSLFDDGPTSLPLMAVPHDAPPMRSAPTAPLAPARLPVPGRPLAAPPAGPAGGLAPAVFRHPQAQREILLDGHVVGYQLKRGRRRSIGFVVSVDGLAVSAPKWVGLADIDAALREKAGWILRKLREQQDRQQRQLAARVDWRDGTSIPYLGEAVIVVLDPRAAQVKGGAELHTDASALPGVPSRTLHVGLPHTATPEQIRDVVQSWLQREARRLFEERCRDYTARLGVQYRRLSLSSAQTRWGSASADGSIRLNWRLIHFALPTIDYVVAHELAHLREMNHSPRFWDVVRSVMPDFETARGSLKDDVLPVFD